MDSTGVVPLLAPVRAVVVALLFALAAVRGSLPLRLAGLCLGVLYALAGTLIRLLSFFG